MKMQKSESKMNMLPMLIGIIVLIIGVFLLVKDIRFISNADKTKAEVVECRIKSNGAHKGNDVYVYVAYTYNGKEYSHISLNQSEVNTYREGEIIDVYVNPDEPSEVTNYNTPTGKICIIFVAFLFISFSILLIRHDKKIIVINKMLEKEGVEIQATVDYVIGNTDIRSNDKNPYKLKCYYVAPNTKKRYEYESEEVLINLRQYFKHGDTIAVTVMPNDYSKYHIDIEKALNSNRVVDFT